MLPALVQSDPAVSPHSVLTLIERRMQCCSGEIAVVDGARSLTYAELDRLSRRIGAGLGLRPEAHVGVRLQRCLELPAVLLAIMRAGGSYVPIDPEFPVERIQSMIADAGIEQIVTTGSLPNGLAGISVRELAELSDTDAIDWRPPSVHAKQLAYTIYTSGSTGRPKGAMNTHEALLNRLVWMQSAYPIGPGANILQKTPFTFDVSVWEFFWPLMYGATLVMAPPGSHRDFQRLGSLIREHRISHLHFVPSMLEAFLQVQDGLPFPDLRQIFCSGEALPTPVAELVLTRFPNVKLDNLYGPTEAAIDVSFHACQPGEPAPAQPIGLPIAGTQLPIYDNDLLPVPVGATGELFIAGVALARGYVGRPALTAERFIPSPNGFGERMYRTGDLCSQRAAGTIDFLGRNDFQVKINGQRIELGDIENQVRLHPDLASALVMARKGPSQRQALVAYVCLHEHAMLREHVVAEHVHAWGQMYESAYQELAQSAVSAADNFLTWNSSYDGLPLPFPAMCAWADEAAARVLSCRPERVLEIGCGSGLIAQRILPAIQHYRGIDPSAQAISYLQGSVSAASAAKVALHVGFAHQIEPLLGDVDTVVLNSVVQYFPDASYLRTVLELCLSVPSVRHIVIGDVRDWRAFDAFAGSLERARDPAIDEATLTTLLQARRDEETELLLAPGWFVNWAKRADANLSVALLPKSFGYDNELSRYRFDVVIRRGENKARKPDIDRDWSTLPDRVMSDAPAAAAIRISGVPLPGWLDHHAEFVSVPKREANVLAQLRAMAEAQNRRVVLRLDTDRVGTMTAWLLPEQDGTDWVEEPSAVAGSVGSLANLPLRRALTQAANATLKPYLSRRLPAYMVPERLVVLAEMPLNLSGKTDRAALPSPWREFHDDSLTAPSDSLEQQIHDVWADLLSAAQVPLDRSLNELGGDSITITQMAIRLANSGLPVTLALVQVYPTIRSLASALRGRLLVATNASPAQANGSPYTPAELERLQRSVGQNIAIDAIYPLRPWLAGMAFETLRAPGRGLNLELLELQFDDLDLPTFASAWQQLLIDHEWLRSAVSFLFVDRPARIVMNQVTLPMQVLDWRDRPEAEQQGRWAALRERAWQEGVALDGAPLFRIQVVRRTDRQWHILWLLHHLVSDGWSYAMLIAELRQHYDAIRSGHALPKRASGATVEAFEHWLRDRQMASTVSHYWQQYLSGMSARAGALPRQAATEDRATVVRQFELSQAETQRLIQQARVSNLSLNDLCVSLAGSALCRHFGRAEWCLGAMYTLRHPDAPGADSLCGPLLTALPVRVRLAQPGFALLEQASLDARTRSGHAAYAVVADQQLRQLVGLSGSQSLFDVALVFENIPEVATDDWLRRVHFNSRTGRPLVWMIWPGERLRIEVYVDPTHVEPELASVLTREWLADLRALAYDAAAVARHADTRAANQGDDVVLEFSID